MVLTICSLILAIVIAAAVMLFDSMSAFSSPVGTFKMGVIVLLVTWPIFALVLSERR